MNSMELVRFPAPCARRFQGRPKNPQPPFAAELIGPVRQAIVRGRQCLVSQQRCDGTWLGQQSVDASLASQLVLLLAYLGREDSELAHQCAATIRNEQCPDGNWRLAPDGPVDVSLSVQCYFALKLTGKDSSDERLAPARDQIRQLGGADAADSTTRFFLALLGQVSYDHCGVILPEWNIDRGEKGRTTLPLSIVWSHRPVRPIGFERGVRELFVNRPKNWPRLDSAGKCGPFRQSLRSLIHRASQFAERRGWTPFRRQALTSAESRLRRQASPRRIAELDFHELLWHIIALDTLGYDADSPEFCSCQKILYDLVEIREATDSASPHLRATTGSDTALAVRSLITSGLSPENETIDLGLRAAGRLQRLATQSTTDLCNFVAALRAADAPGFEGRAALPPDIDVCWDWQSSAGDAETIRRGPEKRKRTIARCIEKLLQHQMPNGGWGATLNAGKPVGQSEPDATSAAIEALHHYDHPNVRFAVSRAAAYLRAAQRGDGSWASSNGGRQVFCTSQAIRGLLAAATTAEDDAVAAADNWLIVRQQIGGGWIESEFNPFECGDTNRAASPSNTAWAVLALVAAGKANHPAVRRGIDLLCQWHDDEGGWHDAQTVICNEATGHSNPWPLLALSHWLVAISTSQSAGSDQMSLRLVGASAEN